MFAAAAIELLPKVLKEDPWVAIGGFAVGIAVMFGMRAVTERLGATAVDFAIDGVILGAGFAAATTTGLLLTIALTIEYLFVGLSLSAALGPQASRRLVIAAPIGLSLLTVAGAALGVWLLSGASATTLAAVLAFGAVAFMYLAGAPPTSLSAADLNALLRQGGRPGGPPPLPSQEPV